MPTRHLSSSTQIATTPKSRAVSWARISGFVLMCLPSCRLNNTGRRRDVPGAACCTRRHPDPAQTEGVAATCITCRSSGSPSSPIGATTATTATSWPVELAPTSAVTRILGWTPRNASERPGSLIGRILRVTRSRRSGSVRRTTRCHPLGKSNTCDEPGVARPQSPSRLWRKMQDPHPLGVVLSAQVVPATRRLLYRAPIRPPVLLACRRIDPLGSTIKFALPLVADRNLGFR